MLLINVYNRYRVFIGLFIAPENKSMDEIDQIIPLAWESFHASMPRQPDWDFGNYLIDQCGFTRAITSDIYLE